MMMINPKFRVAHASRVLAKPSRVRELSLFVPIDGCVWNPKKSSFRRDAETGTRDACATQSGEFQSSALQT